MYQGIIDTHAHMDDPCFVGRLDEVLQREQELGVRLIIQSGSEIPSSERSVKLAETYDCIVASIGVYPNEALTQPEDYLKTLRTLAKNSKRVVAIGEIGMDFGYELHPPKEPQEKIFREQLDLAKELQLPVVIHDRDADEDVIRILRDYTEIHGAIHRIFSDLPYARTLLEMGLHMGIGPQVTYPGSERLLQLVKEMPVEKMLLETDAPFLPVYDRREEKALPSMIATVAETIAALRRDITPQEVIDETRKNAVKLYQLPV